MKFTAFFYSLFCGHIFYIMTKYLPTVILISSLLFACSSSDKNALEGINYPETFKSDHQDKYHGQVVNDPYRWLENDTSLETENWVKAQNKVTFDYLNKIPFRQEIRDRLEEMANYPRVSAPTRVGNNYFIYKNNGLQNQDVIYIREGLDGDEKVFIDPNAYSKNGTTNMRLSGISEDDKMVVVSKSESGSDWNQLIVFDINSAASIGDTLNWVKFSGANWHGNGFYYSRYPLQKEGLDYSSYNANHAVYYHQIGTKQEADKLIFEDKAHSNRYHNVGITEDHAYLVLYAAEGTDGYECHYKSLKDGDDSFTPLFTGFDNKSSILDHHEGRFIIRTDIDAPNYRLISLDPANPDPENWIEIIPETANLLKGVSKAGGHLFANYLIKAQSKIFQLDYNGENLKEIALPGLGSASGFYADKEDSLTFYSYSSFTYPGSVFKYNLKTGKSSLYFQPELAFDPSAFEAKQILYGSKDGTPITMFVVHKKGIKLDGNNPLILYGYGGFNISLTPGFRKYLVPWLESGGIFAMPNLRGGGEYGENWHKGGMLFNKQNVFDDFISAAENLIEKKYTSSEKLVISGRSNGGLLVGAVMTQRPDLFQVALPGVGVMDMLRYHEFTVGHGWVPEYGSSEEEDHYKNLISFSPLHRLQPNTDYPATLVFTGDHDDRVVPAHSFKFAATLQEMHSGEAPVLIRIETDAGHGSGKPISKILDEEADKLAFSLYNTGSVYRR